MKGDPSLTRVEIMMRTYRLFGVDCIDTTRPHHHGWVGKSQKKIRRERRQRGGAK